MRLVEIIRAFGALGQNQVPHLGGGIAHADFDVVGNDCAEFGEDGARHRPVMLHRAILGSFERFLGIVIEQYAGRFPLWLAPVQVVVATIVSDADGYAGQVAAALAKAGLTVHTDLTNQKINAKVREHSLLHVPVLAVVGVVDITRAAVRIGSETYEPLPPFLVAIALYVPIVFVLVSLQRWIERRQMLAEAAA